MANGLSTAILPLQPDMWEWEEREEKIKKREKSIKREIKRMERDVEK